MKKFVWSVLPLLFVLTVCFFAAYATAQQILRQEVNDPQIQLAEDTSALLAAGAPPASLALPSPVGFGASLAPFVNVYDGEKHIVVSSGLLHGEVATPPLGVFDDARSNGEDRFTWSPTSATGSGPLRQGDSVASEARPQSGVRIASILRYYKSSDGEGYVLSGRSMREQESRIHLLGLKLFVGWLLSCLAVIFLSVMRLRASS